MQQWSEGIYLLGRYGYGRPDQLVGCWLFAHGASGAVLEMPPYNQEEAPPDDAVFRAAQRLGVEIRYLLCTHRHGDHFQASTLHRFLARFPHAIPCLQRGFQERLQGKRICSIFANTDRRSRISSN